MNMEFVRKLTIPAEVKEMYPLTGEMARCFEQRTFWWGAQWDSNPRSPDPQSGALTDYAMGTT